MSAQEAIAAFAARKTTAHAAMDLIPRGRHIFIASGAAEPVTLVEAMTARADRFADNTVLHLLTLGPAPYVEERYRRNFRHTACFIGPNVREAVQEGRADYVPVFLSRIPGLIRSRRLPVDVALIQTTPPDRFGYVNVGVSVDIVMAAIESATTVIAEINPRMPVVHGAGFLSADRIHAWVEADHPLLQVTPEPLDEVALEIGRNVARLVEDGSTLQMGIGQIPDAALKALAQRRDLGIWTEMFSDGVLDLLEAGAITGRHKAIHPGKITSSFAFGSERLYRFLDRNPLFTFHPSDYVNDPIRIARQHKMVAINSALQIDLTGQVCADSIGTRFYSGIGGQVDFIRGASMSPGGKPVIAIRSTAAGGKVSRIVPTLDPGAGVVTSRGDVRYVVTEFGTADLEGKSVRERALALVSIAHPDFREELMAAAKQRRIVFLDQLPPKGTYPRRHERTVTTRDGATVLLRPILPADEPRLRDFLYSLSERTLYKRYLRVVNCLPHEDMRYYLDVDYIANYALVAESAPEGRAPELVGIAQYVADPSTRGAETAFVVRDDWQGRGLGSLLLAHLIAIARENGIPSLEADVMADNAAMLHVFHKCGLPVQSRLEDRVYRLHIPLGADPARPGPEDRGG